MTPSARRNRRGFTLVEMLVVILIIGVLAGLLLPVIARARITANIKYCHNNMKQIFTALSIYAEEHNVATQEVWPARLAYLISGDYLPDSDTFSCPLDKYRGQQGPKPNIASIPPNQQFDEVAERSVNLSYMYEMSGAKCTWDWVDYVGPDNNYFTMAAQLPYMHYPLNDASWGEVKTAQFRWGDVALHTNTYTGATYPSTYFPIVRCFWHVDDPTDDRDKTAISNLAYGGNVFLSPPTWEILVSGEFSRP